MNELHVLQYISDAVAGFQLTYSFLIRWWCIIWHLFNKGWSWNKMLINTGVSCRSMFIIQSLFIHGKTKVNCCILFQTVSSTLFVVSTMFCTEALFKHISTCFFFFLYNTVDVLKCHPYAKIKHTQFPPNLAFLVSSFPFFVI